MEKKEPTGKPKETINLDIETIRLLLTNTITTLDRQIKRREQMEMIKNDATNLLYGLDSLLQEEIVVKLNEIDSGLIELKTTMK